MALSTTYPWKQYPYPPRIWERYIREQRRMAWGRRKEPLWRGEYHRLRHYERRLNNACWRLRWSRTSQDVRESLLKIFSAQFNYARKRRRDLSPSGKTHRCEYYQLYRYQRDIERMRGERRWRRDFSSSQIGSSLRNALEVEERPLKARMEDIRHRWSTYDPNDVYCLWRVRTKR